MANTIKKPLGEVCRKPYGVPVDGGELRCCEPTKEEILEAIAANSLERRAYQDHPEKLLEEWIKNARGNDEIVANARRYHAKRAAWFAVNRPWEPIKLKNDGREIADGSHRYLAAWALNEATIEVEDDDPA
jgi:ParB-like chromosome segregation protein Spo0J